MGSPDRQVVCLDGDGSILMHLGALPVIGQVRPTNLLHVLLNNGAHESVGGQPTAAAEVDFEAIARAVGYRAYRLASDLESLDASWLALSQHRGPNPLIRI